MKDLTIEHPCIFLICILKQRQYYYYYWQTDSSTNALTIQYSLQHTLFELYDIMTDSSGPATCQNDGGLTCHPDHLFEPLHPLSTSLPTFHTQRSHNRQHDGGSPVILFVCINLFTLLPSLNVHRFQGSHNRRYGVLLACHPVHLSKSQHPLSTCLPTIHMHHKQ